MLVTDDELIAASAATERRWSGALPSIDLKVPEALIEPASRGLRSLLVRGFLDESGSALGAAAGELSSAITGTVRALVFPADSEHADVPLGPSISVIESAGIWLIDVTAPDGLHDLSEVGGWDRAWQALVTLIESADDLPDDRALTACVTGADPNAGLFVSFKGRDALVAPLTRADRSTGSGMSRMSAAAALDAVRNTLAFE